MILDDIRYDKKTIEALESFHQVWSRVSGPALPKQNPDALPELLSHLYRLHRHYAVLVRSFSGDHRNQLQSMAQETARDYRRLQAAFYIREGRLFSPESNPLLKEKRPLLRSAILLESSLAHCAQRDYNELCASSEARMETATNLLISCI